MFSSQLLDRLLGEGIAPPHPLRLVGDVFLVEGGIARERHVVVGVGVAGRRARVGRRRDLADPADLLEVALVVGGDRRVVEEERPVRCDHPRQRPVGDPPRDVWGVVLLFARTGVLDRLEQLLDQGDAFGGRVDAVGRCRVSKLDQRIDVVAVAVIADGAVLVDGPVEVVVGGEVDQAVPVVPAGRHQLRVAPAVLVQVLADERGLIAGVLEPDRQRVVLALEAVEAATGGEEVPLHPVVVRVLAGQERGPGGAADRVGGEGVGEGGAGPLQAPEVGHQLGVAKGLVVGHDDEHVRAPVLHGAGRRGCGDQRQRRADGAENRR